MPLWPHPIFKTTLLITLLISNISRSHYKVRWHYDVREISSLPKLTFGHDAPLSISNLVKAYHNNSNNNNDLNEGMNEGMKE